MTKETRINELEIILKDAARAYYSGEEIMSDADYDQYIEELRYLDPENEIIAGLANESEEEATGDKIAHDLTTGTLAKCKDEGEFEHWFRLHSTKGKMYSVEQKIDGSGNELKYKDGHLYSVVSRGDGFKGIEKIAMFMNLDFPKDLTFPFEGSIRCETVIYDEEFKQHFPDMANPRNATAGLLNRKVEDLTEEDYKLLKMIHVIAYDVLDKSEMFDTTQSSKLSMLESEGFTVPEHIYTDDFNEIIKFRSEQAARRDPNHPNAIPYGIDGIVIKPVVCDKADLKLRCPKESCAIKFELANAVTEVLDITWELSGSILCPVAHVAPVQLNGTTVQKASLCNCNIIQELGIEIGSMVEIVRRGEVIPHIERVVR